MQRSAKGPQGSSQSIADLRASLRASKGHDARAKLPKPPRARKAVLRESEEDRAVKAEKMALAQHRTSLLAGGKSGKRYVRPGEKPERKGSFVGFVFQLILVLAVVGGVAYALDPTLVPAEWQQKAHELISQYVKI
jgi:hypothetical protein